jgi:hypothetical protein
MASTLRSSVGAAVRDTVPFLVVTLVWTVVMLVFYGLFLALRPAEASYGPAIHASAFVPPLVGFLGHTLREALRDA